MAPTFQKRTRSATDIKKLAERLQKAQMNFWGSGQTTTDNHFLIETLDYQIQEEAEEAEEAFRPFGRDSVAYKDVTDKPIPQHVEYFRLLTGYVVAKYIRKQEKCEQCLADLTIPKRRACRKERNRIVTRNVHDNIIVTSRCLKSEFCREHVHAAFNEAYEILYNTIEEHMPDLKIGERIQETIADQVPFFKGKGTCTSDDHRRNLPTYVIKFVLKGKNFKGSIRPQCVRLQ
uniref:Uncharacterized protein n=1 Tax=Glossina austeni TaxID=7395 RepID=A0A1A9V4C7_GLOAU